MRTLKHPTQTKQREREVAHGTSAMSSGESLLGCGTEMA
jgi:hypothetical protein